VTASRQRLIVVLGYSDGGRSELHPICRERLAHAATIATEDDVVVLSGWARVPGTRSEAELMAAAWSGLNRELVVDPDARSTVGNATNAVDDVVRTGATEVLVVTSRWHAPRAAAAFRWRLRKELATVITTAPPRGGGVQNWLREVPCWAFLPLQLAIGRGIAEPAIRPVTEDQ
jgi:hypothetical protein